MSEIIVYLNLQAAIYCDSINTINKKDCIEKVVDCTLNESIMFCFDDSNINEVLSE